MPRSGAESGVPSSSAGALDFTTLEELFINIRDARMNDVGAMANIFLKSSEDDDTAQLLYPRDGIWPVIVEMLRNYLADDYTHVRVAWDEYTDTIVGWTSISLVTSDQEDYFKFCDSTVWAGRQLLFREAQTSPGGPPHVDTMRRSGLITQLRNRNCSGQNGHINGGQHLVINAIAIHPDIFVGEIPTIAYKLIDDARDLAMEEDLPLWAQFPQSSMVDREDLENIFREIGFAKVGSFELDLTRYASEHHRRRRYWGIQKWTQWLLRTGDWERGRRY